MSERTSEKPVEPSRWRAIDPMWSRRDFLKTAGTMVAGLGAADLLAACGGGGSTPTTTAPAGTVPTPRAGAKITLLQWNSFVPAADDEIRRQAKAFSSQYNVTVEIQTVSGDQLQPKTAASVEAGSGPDIIQMQYAWPHLYSTACLDVTNEVNLLKNKLGAVNQVNDAFCKVGSKYLAIPYCQVPNAWSYRTDIWQQAGLSSTFPATWEELASAGKTLKDKSLPPIAVSLGHAYGDAITMWYPILWDFGGREVSADGKKVTINSKETETALKWAIQTWQAGYISKNTLSWLDPDNNQAYHSGLISATLNGASIYIKETYTTATNHKFAAVTNNAGMPKEGSNLYTLNLVFDHAVMNWTKEADTAKAFLLYLMDAANYDQWLKISNGYSAGPFKAYDSAYPIASDPKLAAFQGVVATGRWPGWPAVPSKQTSQSQVEFVIVDMFAKAVTSGDAKAAISDAEQKLKRIYERPGG